MKLCAMVIDSIKSKQLLRKVQFTESTADNVRKTYELSELKIIQGSNC